MDPDTLCTRPISSAASASSSGSEFVGSASFIAIIAVVIAVPLGAFLLILLILCSMCLLSSKADCSCPKIDCEDCCNSFFKAFSCGLKCDDLNPIVICLFVVLGILAAPAVIMIGAVVIPIFLVGACLIYVVTQMIPNFLGSSSTTSTKAISHNFTAMNFLHIHLLILGAAYCTATLTVDLELIFYNNPTHEDCDGGNDTCLSPVLRTDDLDNDVITFSADDLSVLGISNPVQFSSISTDVSRGCGDVRTALADDKIWYYKHVGAHLQADSEFGPNVTYYGTCGRAYIQVRTRITSECPANRYGPNCTKVCTEVPGRKVCNYIGDASCLGNFYGPDCSECKAGFYGSSCDRFCEPKDSNTSGHYTCDDLGYIVCLPGFTTTPPTVSLVPGT
ncbi:hypothetical protein GBAR_LOCUS17303 [Geodia barretti]|uniref:Delta-like protein n=1 Tax=Geodia barretti TaxID=519541 RepID=A0AA35SJZ5_GEOBA|nr:hypothetical protein GBAR_LOCUS17303 [Geodia barretti]